MSAPSESHELPPGFEVRVRHDQLSASATLEVAGELCISTVDGLDRHVVGLRGQGVARIVLDMRPLSFLDSTGIRLLVKLDMLARDEDFQFAIIVGDGQPRRVLELVGMTERPLRVLD